MKYYLAIDIGASSGRHIVGYMKDGELVTEELYRFPNGMDTLDGHLVWDTERLFKEVKCGIAKCIERFGKIESLSIDTWGVDYVLLKGDCEVKPTYAYRDSRVEGPIEEVHKIIPFEELYSRTGTQFNMFNTVYQLYADKLAGRLQGVTDFLMIPEYLMYKLTGVKRKEFTEATTTGLVNADTLEFDREIFARLGLPEALIAPICQPGTQVGCFTEDVKREVGGDMNVVLCATHDTASAVEAIDMKTDAPYISSGTWSLLGMKTAKPITDSKSRESGYSNEGGVGYNRYQKNITGMWIIQSLRAELCPDTSYGDIAAMSETSDYKGIFDVNDNCFMAPKSMKGAIEDYFVSRGIEPPSEMRDFFNSAYVSLADGYRMAIEDLEHNTGKLCSEIYIVGGGAKNTHLNKLSEAATGKKVVALPIEATAIGNLKVQMQTKLVK